MKKINDIESWTPFFNALNPPHLEGKESVLSSMIKFKYGERLLYNPSFEFLESDVNAFADMINANFREKWERNYNALNLEYDVLYGNRVIYDEDIDETNNTEQKTTTLNQGIENYTSQGKDNNAKNAFDDISTDSPMYSSSANSKHDTTNRTDEETTGNLEGSIKRKKGYIKKYSNGADGAVSIEKDIATRRTRYIELVLKDIVDYITLSVY